MKEFIELLKEKGIVDKLQTSVNVVPPPVNVSPEKVQELMNEAIKECLEYSITKDKELMNKFSEIAIEMAFEALIKELNIQRDPNYKRTREEESRVQRIHLLKKYFI